MTESATGRELGEAGMQLTLSLEPEAWLAAALEGLQAFGSLEGWQEFKTEDFRAWFKRQPHDHHVWGALTNRACRAGILEWTGRYAPSVSPKTHGHPVKVWRLVSLSSAPIAGMPRASINDASRRPPNASEQSDLHVGGFPQ